MKKYYIVVIFLLLLTATFFLNTEKNTDTGTNESDNYYTSEEVIYETNTPIQEEIVSTKVEVNANIIEDTPTPEPEIIKASPIPEAVMDKTPAQAEISDKTEDMTCTLSVRCDDIVNNIELLEESKRKIIPANGVIYPEREVVFIPGESVFDLLLREFKNSKIHLEFVDTPMYNSVYIEGIGNIYEFDCGDTSGWLYRVNGKRPTYGCSQYIIENGDKIEFYYSVDFISDR